MKVKLKDKDNPITKMWCFKNWGYDENLVKDINSGKQVEVEKVPKPAWGYVEEVKKQVKKQTQKKGDK